MKIELIQWKPLEYLLSIFFSNENRRVEAERKCVRYTSALIPVIEALSRFLNVHSLPTQTGNLMLQVWKASLKSHLDCQDGCVIAVS